MMPNHTEGAPEAVPGHVSGRILSPWAHPAFFAMAGALALLGAPEELMAVAVTVYAAIISLLHPLNGVILIFLAVPFFLEVGTRPYFFLLELFCVFTLLGGLFNWRSRERRWDVFPLRGRILLLFFTACAALPLDLPELAIEMWVRSPRDWAAIWLAHHMGSGFAYLRGVYDLGSALALMGVIFLFWPRDPNLTKRLAVSFLAIAVVVVVAGALMFTGTLPRGERYLSLSLVGAQVSMTAFAYNRAFLVQYLSVALFMSVPIVFSQHLERYRFWAGCGALMVIMFPILLSGQRVALVITGVFFVIAAARVLFWHGTLRQSAGILSALLVIIVASWMMGAAVLKREMAAGASAPAAKRPAFSNMLGETTVVIDDYRERLGSISIDPRLTLWNIATGMFLDHPLLGVGTERFHRAISVEYRWLIPPGAWVPTVNSHSSLFQTLAEQGALGLGMWLLLLMGFIAVMAKAFRHENERARLDGLTILTLVVVALLIHAVFNHIMHIRSLQLIFWLSIGGAAALAAMKGVFPAGTEKWPHRALVTLAVAALAWRIGDVVAWSPEAFVNRSIGMHYLEPLPGGLRAQWTLRRAARGQVSKNGVVEVTLSAPLPGLDTRPQMVTVWVENQQRQLELRDATWRTLEFNLPVGKDRPVIVWFETAYTFNPARAGVSRDERDLGVYVKIP